VSHREVNFLQAVPSLFWRAIESRQMRIKSALA